MSQVNVITETKVEKVLLVVRPAPAVEAVTGTLPSVDLNARVPPILASPVDMFVHLLLDNLNLSYFNPQHVSHYRPGLQR